MNEVNFEKRGKLEDHQACPVCGCCVCDGHRHQRFNPWIIASLAFFLFTFTFLLPAWATGISTIPMNFKTFDICLDPKCEQIYFPIDRNDQGLVITDVRKNPFITEVLIVHPKNHKRDVLFGCGGPLDTHGSSINTRGHIVGGCYDSTQKPVGFVRYKNGQTFLLDIPGSLGTDAFGLSDKGGYNNQGLVVGWFWSPDTRGSCFIWDGEFRRIDYFVPNTWVMCEAVTSANQILMRYVTFDPDTNDTIEAGYVLYDNGTFTPLGRDDGHAIEYFADLNELGQAPIWRGNTGDPAFDGIWFFDERLYRVTGMPATWELASVGGANNEGEFVGVYRVQIGVDPIDPRIKLYKYHGYLASPRHGRHISE